MKILDIIKKLFAATIGDKQNSYKSKRETDDEWRKIWNDIYEFQQTLSIEGLPSDEKELEKMGLYIVYDKNAEKLFINNELSMQLFKFRCSH